MNDAPKLRKGDRFPGFSEWFWFEWSPAMSDAEKLADLCFHWGSAYVFWRGLGGTWCARARGTRPGTVMAGDPLVARSAGDLRVLIRADYDKRTVKR